MGRELKNSEPGMSYNCELCVYECAKLEGRSYDGVRIHQQGWIFNTRKRHTRCSINCLNNSSVQAQLQRVCLVFETNCTDLIDYGTSGRVGGFIFEAIQGVGGIMELASCYLPVVYNSIKEAGGVTIADEVQCGFARTGDFWGFEAHGSGLGGLGGGSGLSGLGGGSGLSGLGGGSGLGGAGGAGDNGLHPLP